MYIQHFTVCTFKTSQCMSAPRAHVETHVRVVLVHTGTFLNPHTGARGSSSVLPTKNCPRKVITCFRGSPKKILDLSRFQIENRSRTTCPQFLQSFASPDKAVTVILRETLEGTSCDFVFRSFLQSISNDLHVSIATPPVFLPTLRFSSLVHHMSGLDKTKEHTFTKIYKYLCISKKM